VAGRFQKRCNDAVSGVDEGEIEIESDDRPHALEPTRRPDRARTSADGA
jgi:hypothetical protein